MADKKQTPENVSRQVNSMEYGSAAEARYMAELNEQFRKIDMSYVRYVEKNASYIQPIDNQMEMMMKMRHMMMFSACARPLHNGVSAGSVLECLGMYAGIRLFDKDFHKDVKKGVSEALLPLVEKRVEKSGKEDGFWVRKRDQLLKRANDGHMPMTPDEAALTQIGFLKKAYGDMRQPDADVGKIMRQYENAIATVRKVAVKDGLSLDDVDQRTRFMVGKMIETDPNIRIHFAELAYGDVKQGEYKEETRVYVGSDGKSKADKVKVWRGEFTTSDGSNFNGIFHPRVPEDQNQFGKRMSDRFDAIYKNATQYDSSDFQQNLQVYLSKIPPDLLRNMDSSSFMTDRMKEGMNHVMDSGAAIYMTTDNGNDVLDKLKLLKECASDDSVRFDIDDSLLENIRKSCRDAWSMKYATESFDKVRDSILHPNKSGPDKDSGKNGKSSERDRWTRFADQFDQDSDYEDDGPDY